MATQLVYFARTPNDGRDTARSTGTLNMKRGSAVALAREIDMFGEPAVEEAVVGGIAEKTPDTKHPAASGHGVLVKYASGRTRLIRHN